MKLKEMQQNFGRLSTSAQKMATTFFLILPRSSILLPNFCVVHAPIGPLTRSLARLLLTFFGGGPALLSLSLSLQSLFSRSLFFAC